MALTGLGAAGQGGPLRDGVAGSKASFFDRRAVLTASDAATRRVLSRFGAIVRAIARNSLKTRKGASAPGTPPHVHTVQDVVRPGKPVKKFRMFKDLLFFAYEGFRRTVVIGPAVLDKRDIPGLLEHGGTHPVYGTDYPPRPYMRPAMAKALPLMRQNWKDAIDKAARKRAG